MAESRVNAPRPDPYKSYRFRVRCDGRDVAGVSKVSGLTRVRDVVTHRGTGDQTSSRTASAGATYDAVTLERGLTHDPEFERWASQVSTSAGPRRDVVIDLYDEAGRRRQSFKVRRCWVSTFQALPDLDANADAVAFEHLELQHEGFERDDEATEPVESEFPGPA